VHKYQKHFGFNTSNCLLLVVITLSSTGAVVLEHKHELTLFYEANEIGMHIHHPSVGRIVLVTHLL
jgi:hypothetical protein